MTKHRLAVRRTEANSGFMKLKSYNASSAQPLASMVLLPPFCDLSGSGNCEAEVVLRWQCPSSGDKVLRGNILNLLNLGRVKEGGSQDTKVSQELLFAVCTFPTTHFDNAFRQRVGVHLAAFAAEADGRWFIFRWLF